MPATLRITKMKHGVAHVIGNRTDRVILAFLLATLLALGAPACDQANRPRSSEPAAASAKPALAHSTPQPKTVRASASTEATTEDGTLTIRGLDGSARHQHGGPGAPLGHFRIEVVNRSQRPRTLGIRSIEFLRGHRCDQVPNEIQAHPKPAGLLPEDGSQRESSKTLSVKPGATLGITVGFHPRVEAYYTYCDRFAFRAHVTVDETTLEVVSETRVTRFDPRRRP